MSQQKHDKTIEWAASRIEMCQKTNFYGRLTLIFENGKIVRLNSESSEMPPKVDDKIKHCQHCKKLGFLCPYGIGTTKPLTFRGWAVFFGLNMHVFTDTLVMDAKPRMTADGYLVASPRAARIGIQDYLGREVGRPDLEIAHVS